MGNGDIITIINDSEDVSQHSTGRTPGREGVSKTEMRAGEVSTNFLGWEFLYRVSFFFF